ncbi:MAG: hypothetical protein OEQ74_11310, partial [Gammaproteobacteria bacterium]|nr:hypothetical protein [Gammaproteobacteria bacterium]
HPEGKNLAASQDFSEFAATLASNADDLDLADYIIQLHRLFSHVGDGHTAVLSLSMQAEPFTLRTPILVQGFADGLYVIAARDEALPLLGGRIVSISGTPLERVLAAYVAGAPGDNAAFAMRWVPFLFAFPGWLHGLDFADGPYDGPLPITAIVPTGKKVRVQLQPRIGANTDRVPLGRKQSPVEAMAVSESSINFVRTLPEYNAVYVSLDAMDDTEGKRFAEFTDEARTAFADSAVERVIIDLRRNGGGNNMLFEPLRRTLVSSRFNRPGGLYVLTGPRTFSAAMNLATRLERETDALFVGEPTGGRPNHFGDARMLHGSATGVPYLVSTLRWNDSAPFDDRIWILPDIPAPTTFANYLAGRDIALEVALAHQPSENTTDDELVATPWARPTQQAGWRFFFEAGSDGVSGPVE